MRVINLEHLHGSMFLAYHMNGYTGTRERSPYGGGDDGAQFFPVSAYCMHLQILWNVNQPKVCEASRDSHGCHYQQSHAVNGYMTAGENREIQQREKQ